MIRRIEVKTLLKIAKTTSLDNEGCIKRVVEQSGLSRDFVEHVAREERLLE
jgi:hypothetical protein